MNHSLSVPTDNIYKFSCLFGLVLIISAIFVFSAIYISSLDRKIKYNEVIIVLEAKGQLTKEEEGRLLMNRRLLEITRDNEKFADWFIGFISAIGFLMCGYGAYKWHQEIQSRDDKLAELQIRKLENEIAKIQLELSLSSRQLASSDLKNIN